jgi:hypothetical protein
MRRTAFYCAPQFLQEVSSPPRLSMVHYYIACNTWLRSVVTVFDKPLLWTKGPLRLVQEGAGEWGRGSTGAHKRWSKCGCACADEQPPSRNELLKTPLALYQARHSQIRLTDALVGEEKRGTLAKEMSKSKLAIGF